MGAIEVMRYRYYLMGAIEVMRYRYYLMDGSD